MFDLTKVLLLNPYDSTVISGVVPKSNGYFRLKSEPGSYLVKVICVGFEDYFLDIYELKNGQTLALDPVVLKLDTLLDLDEVVATGSLDVLKAGIDKKIYTVEEDISVRGGSASDVLNNIPSIDVDQDGNISLRGDGNVTILIDGRPSALVAGDGQNLLDALPANSIERIEVVTNPSAKYDPDGTSGIINIVMKKNKLKGMNGIVSVTAATGNILNGNLGLSYRNKRFNVYTNYSMNYYEGYRNNFSDLYQDFGADSSNFLDQDRIGADLKTTNTLVLGSDFTINKRNVIGFSLTGNLQERVRTGDLVSGLYDQNDVYLAGWNRSSLDPTISRNADVNLNYTHTLKDRKGKWSMNANQSFGGRNIEGHYEEQLLDANGISLGVAPLNQQLFNTSTSKITTAQTDLEYIIAKISARIEAGAKMILRADDIMTFSEHIDTLTNIFVSDSLANFDYAYDEQIYSIYGIFGQQRGKLSYQAGLRTEYALQIPNLISTGEVTRNEYFNLFPSAHLKYEPKEEIEFSLSYSRRINRAKSRQLNPFTSYANPFNVRTGNPELQPEYIDSYDLGYALTKKKIILSISVFHRRTTDVINRIKSYRPDNSSVVTYANIDKSVSTGVESIIIYKPTAWMKNQLSFNGNYIDYTNSDSTVDWNNDGFNWNVKYVLSIDFWKKTASFQLNGNYSAPRVTPQGIILSRTQIDASVEKRLLDKKLSIGFRVTDIFDTKGFRIDLDQEGIQQDVVYKWLTRRFYVTASYRFGKLDQKIKAPRLDQGGGI
ncbi:MAG: outer membrane receptor protein involved in Fe transport [Flavobacteriaceae bacterium]|jgi:outer membrane receptor protein involved in Fe transport